MGNKIPDELLLALAAKNSGGGGGGTTNYNDLNNKPKINNVELSGNKSASTLGLQADVSLSLTNDAVVSDRDIIDGQGNTLSVLAEALTKTASGNPVVITDCAGGKARSLKTTIEPIQDLHGYDHPWVGGAGKNLLNSTLNSYSNNGVTITKNDDGTYKLSGTATDTIWGERIGSVKLKAGTYKLVGWNPNTPGRSDAVMIYIESHTNIKDYGQGGTTFTIEEETTYYVRFVIVSGTTIDTVIKPMITKDINATYSDYAPYSNECPISGRTAVTVDDVGKNLYNNEVGTSSDSGITYTKNADGIIKATGTASANSYYNMTNVVFPAGTYAFNGCPSGGADNKYKISLFNVTTQQTIGTGDTGSGNTFTANGTDEYRLFIRVNNGYAFPTGGLLFKPMVRLASITDDTYEPYNTVSVTIQLGQTVYGADINWDTGVMSITSVKIKGNSPTWTKHSTSINNVYITDTSESVKPSAHDTVTNSICSDYEHKSWDNLFVANAIGFAISNNGRFAIANPNIATLSAFETAIADADICYELATPTTIQLTPEQLTMLKGYNRVTIDNGTITLDYIAKAISGNDEEIAPLVGDKATKSYAVNDFIERADGLYRVTAPIASGASFTANNTVKMSIGEALTYLYNK